MKKQFILLSLMLVGSGARAATISAANPDKPAEIVMESAGWTNQDFLVSGPVLNEGTRDKVAGNFTWGQGGTINEIFEELDTNQLVIATGYVDSTLSSNGTATILVHTHGNSARFGYDHTNSGGSYTITQAKGSMSWGRAAGTGLAQGFDKSSQVCKVLHTGGKGGSSKNHLFQLTATAGEQLSKAPWFRDIPSTQISVAGKTLNEAGVAYGVFPDNAQVDCTPEAGGGYYHFTGNASKDCAPKKIDFYDWPSVTVYTPIPGPHNHLYKNYHLMAVCHKTDSQGNWDTKNYPLAEIDYTIRVDTNGTVYTNIWNSGTAGDCGKNIIDSFTKKEDVPDPDPKHTGNCSGAEIKAHFIGCCDDDIAWVQKITNYENNTEYFDGVKDSFGNWVGQAPYYYCSDVWKPVDPRLIGDRMSGQSTDYTPPPDSNYPIHCP